MNKTPTVSIVIPNWNGANLLQKHLPAVLSSAKEAPEIIVVDDASTDGSVDFLRKKFPSIKLITKTHHEGFTSTVNVGVEESKGDIVVLLNTDVEPEPGFLKPLLVNFSNTAVFAVGCLEKSMEGATIVLRGRGEAAWEKGFFVHRRGEVNQSDTAWVSGGGGAFRKSLWIKLGGMDPLYNPFYWEDIDISYRARRAGYKILFEPKSMVNHFHEEGKIKQEFSAQQVRTIAYRNQFIFIWKNLSDLGIWWQHCLWTPIRLFQALVRGDMAMMLGFGAAVIRLPQIISSRYRSCRTRIRRDREITSPWTSRRRPRP